MTQLPGDPNYPPGCDPLNDPYFDDPEDRNPECDEEPEDWKDPD